MIKIQKSSRRMMSVAAVCAVLAGRVAWAGVNAAVQQSRTTESKLAPELLAAQSSGSTFIGLTIHSPTTQLGQAVLQVKNSFTIADARNRLNGRPGVVQVTGLVPESHVRRIRTLVIGFQNDHLPNDDSLAGLKVIRPRGARHFVTVQSDNGFTPQQISALGEDPRIRYVEPNYPYELTFQGAGTRADDGDLTKLWGMRAIHAPEAWSRVHDAPDVVVAVLDTGVDYNHTDLRGNIWTNRGEVGKDSDGRDKGTNGYDDDCNGYVDDVHGYDFIDDDGDPDPGRTGSRFYHGTFCAGTIGACRDSKAGMVGVAWKVQIMALRIFDRDGTPAQDKDIARAIDYAVANGAKVISSSWAGPNYAKAVKEAIDRASASGVLFVTSAANEGNDNDGPVPYYPASYRIANILAVMAIDKSGAVPGFSNWGRTSVHLAAPGVGIYSTVPGNQYDELDGTSFAAPYVTGAAALILALHPEYKSPQIKQTILDPHHLVKLQPLETKCSSGGVLDIKFLGAGAPARAAH